MKDENIHQPSTFNLQQRPSVDILLATYNGEVHLEEQIESLISQDFHGWRLLVRDDGSRDGTLDILSFYAQKYGEKITIVSNGGGNLGPAANFSELMVHSDADYVMWCDQDDLWMPEKIRATLEKMRAMEDEFGNDTPLLVHTNFKVADGGLTVLAESGWQYQKTDPQNDSFARLLVQNVVTGCTAMLNKALCDLVRPIPRGALMHDHWVALTAAAFGEIGYLSEPTLLYRQHGCNQVGAQPWTVSHTVSLLRDLPMVRKVMARNRVQAKEFYERYKMRLDGKERATLEAFMHLQERGRVQRRLEIFKFRFFYTGALRNLGWLLLC